MSYIWKINSDYFFNVFKGSYFDYYNQEREAKQYSELGCQPGFSPSLAGLPAQQSSLLVHGIPIAVLEKWQIALDPGPGEGSSANVIAQTYFIPVQNLIGIFITRKLSVPTNNLVKPVIA